MDDGLGDGDGVSHTVWRHAHAVRNCLHAENDAPVVSCPPFFAHDNMGTVRFGGIFGRARLFFGFFSLCTSPSSELKSSGMESPAPKTPKKTPLFKAYLRETHFFLYTKHLGA